MSCPRTQYDLVGPCNAHDGRETKRAVRVTATPMSSISSTVVLTAEASAAAEKPETLAVMATVVLPDEARL